jgi:hypothetical protein
MKKRLLSILLILVLLLSAFPLTAAATDVTAETAANKLYELGLFRGTDDGYELERQPTRQEALVMLIRLLGKESAALNGDWNHPFTDVDSLWVDSYVGYAYQKNLTTGYSATAFGGRDYATAAHYITLVLRALGYSEAAGDFVWSSPWTLSDELGLTDGEYNADSLLTRGDVAVISYRALNMRLKGGDMTLLEYLQAGGAIGQSQNQNGSLSATEISEKCSSAVFYIEVYSDANHEKTMASGSGFFVNGDGAAVTNFHVIKKAESARITLTSGERYDVLDVIYASEDEDLAVLRVSKTSTSGKTVGAFDYLETGDSTAVKNGDTIYTISSPLGLQNTMSNGIVSNAGREMYGTTFLQITAAISSGSSGGALLNDHGQVVGVTTGSFKDSQNLNLAVPISKLKDVDLTTAGQRFAAYFDNYEQQLLGKYTLTASKTNLTLKAGEMEKIIITNDCRFDVTVEWDSDDWQVAYCEWGEWVDDYSTELYIMGVGPGKTTVTVVYADGTGSPDAKAVINVQVTE